MPYISLTSGLTLSIPTKGTTGWNDTMLNSTFKKISSHDHTGSGKGLQIGTSAIAALAVTAAKIAADAVITAKILDANVTTAKLADNAVTTVKILDGNVTADKLAADSVTTVKILDVNVTTGKLADSAVSALKLAADAVTTVKILDANVTSAKLAADAASRKARIARGEDNLSNGTAGPTQLSNITAGIKAKLSLPTACVITHVTLDGDADKVVTGGTLSIHVYKNGVLAQSAAFTNGSPKFVAITPVSFAAGDTISLFYQTAAATFTGGAAYMITEAWGYFTA